MPILHKISKHSYIFEHLSVILFSAFIAGSFYILLGMSVVPEDSPLYPYGAFKPIIIPVLGCFVTSVLSLLFAKYLNRFRNIPPI